MFRFLSNPAHNNLKGTTMKDLTLLCLIAVGVLSVMLVLGHHIPLWVGAGYFLCAAAPLIVD